ncbi:MAG: 3-isopropylmalate dehydratase [Chloroflexi bacterium]|nr:3-isopropylmalate dehydratase [Chloroflexota bacterium]
MPARGVIRGRVWKFGDNISTTDITPNEMFRDIPHTPKDTAFAAIRPGWRNQVRPGDCIVAGQNFAFGSHRASANDVMKQLGIGCIVADSIARIFYRTAVAIGFSAMACQGVSNIFNEGDELELDVRSGLIRNLTSGDTIQGERHPPQLLEILEAGGIMPLLVKKVNG